MLQLFWLYVICSYFIFVNNNLFSFTGIVYNEYQFPMAKMRYSDMPRDVSIDNFPSLNVSEVTLSLVSHIYAILIHTFYDF
jgi:hypothetical protein